MMARMQKKTANTACWASFRSRSIAGRCLGMSSAYTGMRSDAAGGGLRSETLPLVNEYGCLHTSQVFFLLWESHVVKLNGISARSGEIRQVTVQTNLGGCTGSCPSICRDKIAADLVPRARCRFGKCLGPCLFRLLASPEIRFQV